MLRPRKKYTVYDLQQLKGKRCLTHIHVKSPQEAAAAEQAGVDLMSCSFDSPEAQARFDKLEMPPADVLRIEYFCRVVEWRRLESLADAQRAQKQHVWKPEVIAERFEWGRSKAIFALAVRSYRLPERIDLPMLPMPKGAAVEIEIVAHFSTP